MKKLTSLLLAILLVPPPSSATCSTTYTPAKNPVPLAYFGQTLLYADTTTPWPSIRFGILRTLGTISWDLIETSRGVYNWGKVDTYTTLAASHGVDMIFTFVFSPTWANTSGAGCTPKKQGAKSCPPSNNVYFTEFVTAAVQRYCGKIKYWETWNEPELTFAGTPAQMVTLASLEYPIIHSTANCACDVSGCGAGHSGTNPNVVLAPPISTLRYQWALDWETAYMAAGGSNWYDILTFHGYNALTPEDLAPWLNSFKRFASTLNAPQTIWDTEGSWSPTIGNTALYYPQDRAAWVGRFYLMQWAMGVEEVGGFAYDSDKFETMWTAGAGENSVAAAYGEVGKWMVGASEACTGDRDGNWTCTLTRPGYTAYAVWSVNGGGTFTLPDGVVQYRDLAGNKTAIRSGSTVPRTTSPLLYETGNAW